MLNTRLADRDFVAGDYSIADMAIFPWARLWERQGQDIAEFPNMARWLDRIAARPATAKALEVGREERAKMNLATDKAAQSVLFGQRAR